MAPREVESNTMMGCPKDGASDRRTVRGTMLRHTLAPKWARTSLATWSASLVRASYMVRILTMYDARTKLADQVAKEVRAHFGAKVCRNIVPRTVRLSEAPSFGQPIIVFDSTSRGAIAYRELAKEVSGGAPQRVG